MLERIKQLELELDANKLLTKSEFKIGEPEEFDVKVPWFKSIQKYIGKDVKSTFETVVREFGTLEILYHDDEETVIHEVNIGMLPYMTFTTSAQKRYIHAEEAIPQPPNEKPKFADEFVAFAKRFYPLDVYRNAFDEQPLCCVKPADEHGSVEFWQWHNAGNKYQLRFKNFEEYIRAGIDCKFIVNWQYFYIDTEALDFADAFTHRWIATCFYDAISDMKECLEKMKKFFPNEDWSYQESELERVKDINEK